MNNIITYIAYSAGFIFILLGLAILFTNITPEYMPAQLKVMMGIVLFMYGIFRIVSTIFKKRHDDEDTL